MFSEAEREIAELDRSLAVDGEDILLRRIVGTTNQLFSDVRCRAFVRGYAAVDLIASITQRQRRVILSPTQINQAQWPGGQPPNAPGDPRIASKNRGDKCIILSDRSQCAVEEGGGIYLGPTLIRIEMRVLG